MPNQIKPCDLAMALRDLSADIARHIDGGSRPDEAELRRWSESIGRCAKVSWAVISASEDIIELGSSPELLAALESSMALAQGQTEYWARNDRW